MKIQIYPSRFFILFWAAIKERCVKTSHIKKKVPGSSPGFSIFFCMRFTSFFTEVKLNIYCVSYHTVSETLLLHASSYLYYKTCLLSCCIICVTKERRYRACGGQNYQLLYYMFFVLFPWYHVISCGGI